MPIEHLVVVGASSGGIEAVSQVVAGLPPDLPAPICVVLHVAPESPGVLHRILASAGRLPAEIAEDGDRLQPGRIYVAPSDHHLLVEPGTLRVTRGPRENRFRPAIDPLFRSAAQVYGPRTIGVVLTGLLDDGSAGLWTIKQLGGVAIVQDPNEATFPSMPLNALRTVEVDYAVRLADIAPLLVRLTGVSVHERPRRAHREVEVEVAIAKGGDAGRHGVQTLGQPSEFACPECHGVLLEVVEGSQVRYRCHTGHAFSAMSLVAETQASMERALWTAVRALEEGGRVMRRASEALDGKVPQEAEELARAAERAAVDADAVRAVAQARVTRELGDS